MTIIFPDSESIAQVGSINIRSSLPNNHDKLREYAIVLRADKDQFFKDLKFTWDGTSIGPGPNGLNYVNTQHLQQIFSDKRAAHFQYGNKFDLIRYSFPLNCQGVTVSSDKLHIAHRSLTSGAHLTLYAVFLDAWGHAVPSWKETPNGDIDFYYEFFGDSSGEYATSYETEQKLASLLGFDDQDIKGFNISDTNKPETLINIISGPGSLQAGAIQGDQSDDKSVMFDNLLMLNGHMPKIKGISNSPLGGTEDTPYYYNHVVWKTGVSNDTILRKLNLVKASDVGLQTFVFAVINDAYTSALGLSDVVPVMRRFLSMESYYQPVFAFKDFDLTQVNNTEIQFKDTRFNIANTSFYSSGKIIARSQFGLNQCMFFPPVKIANAPSEEDEMLGYRKVNIYNIHKGMPNATLGHRLLQLYSVVGQPDVYFESTATANDTILQDTTKELFDITQGIAKSLDLSNEPDTTHNEILAKLQLYLMNEDGRLAFLNDFNSKFPNVLTKTVSTQAIDFNQALLSVNMSFNIVIYVNINYIKYNANGPPIDFWIRNIPIVVQLTK